MTDALTNAPRLTTERLVLRGLLRSDLAQFTRFITTSPDLAAVDDLGSESDAWYAALAGVGHWHWHGYGFFTLQRHDDTAPLGRVGILNHHGWPQPELAWHLFEGATGQGYATEAGMRVRDWAAAAHGLRTLVSYIDTDNAPSQAVATRLGATNTGQRAAHDSQSEIWQHPEGTA